MTERGEGMEDKGEEGGRKNGQLPINVSLPQRGKMLVEIIIRHNIAPEEQNNLHFPGVMPRRGMSSYSNYISTNILPLRGMERSNFR